MSIKKKYLKSKPICKVKFVLEKERAANKQSVRLLGSFNNWDAQSAITMTKLKSGSFTAELPLEAGQEYEFRYLIDGQLWENDSHADKYKPSYVCEAENSVIVV